MKEIVIQIIYCENRASPEELLCAYYLVKKNQQWIHQFYIEDSMMSMRNRIPNCHNQPSVLRIHPNTLVKEINHVAINKEVNKQSHSYPSNLSKDQ